MKRCPDCGFRANDDVCPLCGVKMRGYSAPVRTHVHSQPGERCVLPNQKKETSTNTYQPKRRSRDTGTAPSGFGIAVAAIILISVLRSCMG